MSLIDDLESSIDILELVSRYTKLKKSWMNYKSVCPFPGHNEKTASFMVSPSKQLAYCFWCHKGWAALKFVMDIENIDFKEAVNILSGYAWIKLNSFNHSEDILKKNIYSIYKDISNYYISALNNNLDVKKYLFDRNLSEDAIKKFLIWYSDSGLSLYNFLKNKGYKDDLINEAKVFSDFNNKKDKFINRIIFPIQNIRWDIVAFTARIIWKWEPKYINSIASNIYDKSSILYGLYSAKSEIIKKDFVIITEWQMDTISMQSNGFLNTVCVSWTALTQKHLTSIKRLTNKIYLCFDWDQAGKKATDLAIDIVKNKGFELKIIDLVDWKDPDEIIKSWEDFWEYIKMAKTPIAYYIDKTNFNIDSIEDKKKILNEILEILNTYFDNIEQDTYLKELSKRLDLREYIIYDTFNRIKLNNHNNNSFEDNKFTQSVYSAEDLAIWYIIIDTKYLNIVKDKIFWFEYINNDLTWFINDKNYINSIMLDKKNKYKSIAMQIEFENESKNDEIVLLDLYKIIKKINNNTYKKVSDDLKSKISTWDEGVLEKYSKIILEAKRMGIK